MTVCKNGLNKMHTIIARSPGDVRCRLWSLYWLVRMTQQTDMVVELGVRRGDTTRALLAACEDCGSRLFSWDIEDVGAHVEGVTRSYGIPWFEALWEFKCQDSVKGGLEWPAQHQVDMVFVDTDHTYETTKAEIAVWHRHVRVGGCMVFHDYWLREAPRDGVKPAVDEFCDARSGMWLLETHDAGPDGDTGLCVIWKLK